jgi:hypothetical protein
MYSKICSAFDVLLKIHRSENRTKNVPVEQNYHKTILNHNKDMDYDS